jgi:hypothetical protein
VAEAPGDRVKEALQVAHFRRELVEQLSTIDVLFLEDFGMKTLRGSAAEDMPDVMMRRHERLPTVIITNRPTEDWGKFLGDVPAATAILDRFLQHVEITLMEGPSYRLGGRHTSRAIANERTPAASTESTTAPDPSAQNGLEPNPSDCLRRDFRAPTLSP